MVCNHPYPYWIDVNVIDDLVLLRLWIELWAFGNWDRNVVHLDQYHDRNNYSPDYNSGIAVAAAVAVVDSDVVDIDHCYHFGIAPSDIGSRCCHC